MKTISKFYTRKSPFQPQANTDNPPRATVYTHTVLIEYYLDCKLSHFHAEHLACLLITLIGVNATVSRDNTHIDVQTLGVSALRSNNLVVRMHTHIQTHTTTTTLWLILLLPETESG